MRFVLELDLADHQHPDNRGAEHAKVREILALAAQAIGSSHDRSGELTIPHFDPRIGASRPVKIGDWRFVDDKTDNEGL
jgi:hypothetical protein